VSDTPTPFTASAAPILREGGRGQFFQAAAQNGLIGAPEALAPLSTGVIPASLASAIAALPSAAQFSARMAVLGDQTFERSSTIVAAPASAMNEAGSALDALFTLAATL
jgi:hypothetical protein